MDRGHNWGLGCVRGARVFNGSQVGRIVAVRERSFDVEFEREEPLKVQVPSVTDKPIELTLTHFKQRFRRSDGRRMGGKIYNWATPANLEDSKCAGT